MQRIKKTGYFLSDAVLIIGVCLLLTQFVFSIGSVSGASMQSTLIDGQKVIVDRLTYRIGDPKRFDIVMVKFPNEESYWVKRVIGLPGEKIEYIGNKLFVNGQVVQEDFLDPTTITAVFRSLTLFKDSAGVIPDGQYLVVGDNRSNSDDSRNPKNGAISKENIVGVLRVSVYPFDRFGLI